MAYYEKFTKKPENPRDNWRDDEETLRPARDGGRAVPTERRYGERKSYGERREFDRRDDRRSYGDKPAFERGPRPERREFDRRDDRRDDRRPYGDKPAFERGLGQDRPARPERREFDRRDDRRDDRRPYGDKPAFERGPRPERRDDRRDFDRRPPMPRPEMQQMDEEPMESNLLVGRNPIREALKAGRDIEKLLVARGELIGSAREIVGMARDAKIVVQEVARERLDAMAPNHQGLIAVASAYSYKTVEDMLALAKERGEAPFLVILDGVTDPHNLGAIVRSAECVGAHGVIIPERRAVGLTPSAVKASAGAVEHIPVAKEVNLTRTIERLKKEGVWVYGAAMKGEDFRKVDFSGPAALVIGSEGEGISRLVMESCDRLVSLPIKGQLDSLNASVAAGVLLYAMMGARG